MRRLQTFGMLKSILTNFNNLRAYLTGKSQRMFHSTRMEKSANFYQRNILLWFLTAKNLTALSF